ncbi:MAG: hypothetical protein OHK93_001831 [Ramalina farinacea]|uniref:Homeobox domain-containing protein n=1 Tax=Ramalina farinacea TaxID=258253 RepID=A0AA43QR45_9LECA|nr:hypothetical protein [Ramalina farinacea]
MAEPMFGAAQPSDPNSEWAQFDFGQQQLRAYPAPDLDFQTSNPITNYQQPSYADYTVNNHAVQYDGHGQAIFQQPSGTDAENAQPRLTQDQIAALENTFVEAPKPKMEHKKNLAERLGLELPRVNHWFQNRRQKAKSQRHHSKQKSDVSSSDGPSGGIAQTLSLPTSETPISSTTLYGQQAPFPATEFSPDFHLDGTHSFPQSFDMHPTAAVNFNTSHDSHGYHAQPVGLDDGLIAGPVWMNELQHMPTGESYGSSAVDHQAITSISPESLTGSHSLLANASDSKPDHINQPFPHSHVMGSGFLDNLSSQTLDSNTSSICDTNNLMTPPTNTPPLPWLTSEFDGRRTSDSSELAHNVEGMHIQQNQSGLGLFDAKVNRSTESHMTSATGIATPEASPEQVISKSVPPSDIASRRKRQKPAALRPDSGRSASFAGPVLGSPHARTPSTSLAHPNQVRRIQSQGQTLNHQYRVQKNTAMPAQISPRNLQAYFDKQTTPQTYKHSTPESANNSPTTIQTLPNRPSASAASANRSPAEYQHEFHVARPNNRWNSNSASSYQIPHHANSSVPDLHVATSLPSNPLVHGSASGLPSQQYSHAVSYHCPPQSAPPHQTSFFDNSPINQNGPFQPPGPHGPFFPAVSHGLDLGSPAMHQPTPFAPQHSHSYLSSHLPPFAPVYQFPQESPATSNLSQTLFAGLYPSQISEPTIPPPELDIRVDVGPEPKLASRFDKFEFNHTFADKYAQQGEKK